MSHLMPGHQTTSQPGGVSDHVHCKRRGSGPAQQAARADLLKATDPDAVHLGELARRCPGATIDDGLGPGRPDMRQFLEPRGRSGIEVDAVRASRC